MKLVSIGTGDGRIWINAEHIQSFEEYDGVLTVKFVGEKEAVSYPWRTAKEFAQMIERTPQA